MAEISIISPPFITQRFLFKVAAILCETKISVLKNIHFDDKIRTTINKRVNGMVILTVFKAEVT